VEYNDGIRVVVADASHEKYVDVILATITDSAKKRGSGIASRTHEYLATKMKERKAVIALAGEGDEEEFAGFCYIESWGNKEYVANSGLILVEEVPASSSGHPHQADGLHAFAPAVASCQIVRVDEPECRDEDQYGVGLRAGHFCRADGRRGLLERLRHAGASVLRQL